MYKKIVLVIFIAPLLVNGNTISLSWQESVSLVKSQNSDLLSAQETLRALKELESVSQSGYYPHIYSTLNYNQNNIPQDSGLQLSTKNYTAQLTVSQNLFAGLTDWHKSKQAQANTVVQNANVQMTKANIYSQLKQAYASLNFCQNNIKLSEEIVMRRQQNLNMVQLRYEGGLENKGSVLLYQAYYEQAQFEAEQSKHQQIMAEENLKKILNISKNDTLSLTEVLKTKDPLKVEPDFENIIVHHPNVVAAKAQEESSQEGIEVVRSSFFPTLDLSGSVGQTDTHFYPQENKWNVGLTLTIPLFDGFRDSSNLHSSLAKWQAVKFTNASLDRQTLVELKQAYLDYVEYVQKSNVDNSFKTAAIVRAEIARNKYKNGLMTFDSWDQVENDLIARQKSALTSLRDAIIYEVKWEQSQGIGEL